MCIVRHFGERWIFLVNVEEILLTKFNGFGGKKKRDDALTVGTYYFYNYIGFLNKDQNNFQGQVHDLIP